MFIVRIEYIGLKKWKKKKYWMYEIIVVISIRK